MRLRSIVHNDWCFKYNVKITIASLSRDHSLCHLFAGNRSRKLKGSRRQSRQYDATLLLAEGLRCLAVLRLCRRRYFDLGVGGKIIGLECDHASVTLAGHIDKTDIHCDHTLLRGPIELHANALFFRTHYQS